MSPPLLPIIVLPRPVIVATFEITFYQPTLLFALLMKVLFSWWFSVFWNRISLWSGVANCFSQILSRVSISCPCALPVCTARRWKRRRGGRRGRGRGGHFHLLRSSSQQPGGRATSSMPSNGPLFHTSHLPSSYCTSLNFRKAHNSGLLGLNLGLEGSQGVREECR